MTSDIRISDEIVHSGLQRATNENREYLAEAEGSTLWFYPGKDKSSLMRCFFSIYNQGGKARVRYQGIGAPKDEEFDLSTEDLIVGAVNRLVDDTVKRLGVE